MTVQPKIRANVKDRKTYERQMHGWFDGFETLKLINFLTRNYYSKIPLPFAVKEMLEMHNLKYPCQWSDDSAPGLEDCLQILFFLRRLT